jgi:transcriptional regulator of aroF, aroG, tyrA and aromatic amino acid transport
VRELKNVIERAAILCEEESIDANRILFSHELNHYHPNSTDTQSTRKTTELKKQVIEFEKEIIQQTFALKKSIRQTAIALAISHPALLKKMRKYGMKTVRTNTLV